jgi:hypothetical protein
VSKLITITNTDGGLWGYLFECPGCGENHGVPTTGAKAWGFNGDLEKPTFTPSILLYETKRTDGTVVTPRCHSFVRDGRIEFCGDCGHALAGKTVDMTEAER